MRNKIIFAASGAGLLLALVSAWLLTRQPPALPPAFAPAADPFKSGIYAEGIIESAQEQGENINIYPEVSGPITRVVVREGEIVHKGQALITIDDSVQRATVEQQKAQSQAALSVLEELRAEPRPEVLAVAAAQVVNARATLKNAEDELAKQQRSYAIAPLSVSLEALDDARNAEKIAASNLKVVERNYDLTRAGAWIYDIENQQRQYIALTKAYEASAALLDKYTLRAPADGQVLAIEAAVGGYISPQGAYDTYTQGMDPVVVLGKPPSDLEARVYIDEILVPRLAPSEKLKAVMDIRGTNVEVPLTFERIEPYVQPKIELSDERLERVDLRVLPLIFRFTRPQGLNLYPGELVDVYVGQK